jgi:xylulokinase
MPDKTIGASYGAVFLATGAVGTPHIDVWNPVVDVWKPLPHLRDFYEERYALYRQLYPATAPIAQAVAQAVAPAESCRP